MKFVLSDESVNGYGYKVLTSGIDLTAFKKNPIMLWAHDSSQPIGKWVNIEVKGGRLLAEPQLYSGKDAHIDKVRGMLDEGIINAVSIGFKALDWADEHTVSACELFEASLCPLPANTNAVRSELSRPGTSKKHKAGHIYRLQIQSPVMNLKAELLKALGLPEDTTDEAAFDAVKKLLDAKDKEQLARVKDLVEAAAERGKITESEKSFYLTAGKHDAEAVKKQLEALPPKQPAPSLMTFLQAGGYTAAKHETGGPAGQSLPKDKGQWKLHDYRKHAPHELRANPELYSRLIAEAGGSSTN